MPKINPIKINISNGPLNHIAEYETHVLANGEFQTLIPDVDVDRLLVLELKGVRVTKNKADKPILKAVALADIERVLHAYGRSLLETEKTSELLIFYHVTLDIAYATNPHLPGKVFPNGGVAQQGYGDGDYRWHGPTENGVMGSKRQSVGVSAKVVRKTIHRMADGRFFVEHTRADLTRGTFGYDLNEWNTSLWPSKDYWSKDDPTIPRIRPGKNYSGDFLISEGLHYVPYTEEAAEFFVNMLTSMATLAERMRMFFGNGSDGFLENLNDPNKIKLLAGK